MAWGAKGPGPLGGREKGQEGRVGGRKARRGELR